MAIAALVAAMLVGAAVVAITVRARQDSPSASPIVRRPMTVDAVDSTSSSSSSSPTVLEPPVAVPTTPATGAPPVTTRKPGRKAETPVVVAPRPPGTAAPGATHETVQGETLAPGNRVNDASAAAGAFAHASTVQGDLNVVPSTYRIRTRVRAPHGARVDLDVANQLVGSWNVGSTWQEVEGLAWVGSDESIGVRTAGSTIDVDWISVEPAAPSITVRGTRLLGPGGGAFMPRGVNFPAYNGPRSVDGRLQVQPAPIEHFYRWGASIVRLALNQEHWLADCPTEYGDEFTSYRGAITRAVNDITGRGLAVVLVLTVTERGKATGCAPAGVPFLKEMADTRSVPFWRSVAETFRGNGLVIFDLFNEPNNISESVWRDGGRATDDHSNRTYEAVGMQTLLSTVRAAGATNAVTVSGLAWAFNPTVLVERPLDGAGFAAGIHIYCPKCGPASPRLPGGLDTNVAPLRGRHALVVTEGGWEGSDDPRYNRALIDWAQANSAGWALYAFFVPEQSFSLVREWDPHFHVANGADTLAPSRRGAPVWNTLASERGARGFAAEPVAE
jgi:hypothetical protein